jgi:hypothetical protein
MVDGLPQMTILNLFGSPPAPRPAVALHQLLAWALLHHSKLPVGH